MHIDLKLDHLLPSAERQAINQLSEAVYPPGVIPAWGLAPIEWAPQTVRAMLWEDEHLVCHVGALIRCALIDGRPVQVGGIGGVMTAPDSRRRGYAQAALAAMRAYLVDDQQVSFSLLFCGDNLRSLYGKLDWRLFADPPLVEQHGMTIEFTLNPAMVQDGIDSAPVAGRLDLRGPPW
jgi:GNAT superfamily N-acetyltransferase